MSDIIKFLNWWNWSDFKRSRNCNSVPKAKNVLFIIVCFLILRVQNGSSAPIANMQKLDQDRKESNYKPIDAKSFINGPGIDWPPFLPESEQDTLLAKLLRKCSAPEKHKNVFHVKPLILDVSGQKWPVHNLSFKISTYPSLVEKLGGRERINAEMENAFRVWEDVTNLTFTRMPAGDVNIEISFERGYYASGFKIAFDGPGAELARTSTYTSIKVGAVNEICFSQIHFDDDEEWNIKSIFDVAVHEAGHALGLGHSRVSESVMWYAYNGNPSDLELHSDDILAIQALYGKRATTFTDLLVWIWETTLRCIFMILTIFAYIIYVEPYIQSIFRTVACIIIMCFRRL